jgi:hypothetical protein
LKEPKNAREARNVMPATACLKDIVDALEMQFDEAPSFFDRETGQVVTISLDLLREAEESDADDDEDDPESQDKEWALAKRIAFSLPDRFPRLPSQFDVHEWAIMEEFSDAVESESVREDLLHAIHGPGAFRNFKYNVRRHGIEKTWYAFRTNALRQIAIEWCEEHHIAWK